MSIREQLRERRTGWGARLSFGAVLLVFSEGIVWQTPTTFSAPEWIGIAAIYLALAAAALDLIARWRVNEALSLFMLAGLYGVINATLISHITSEGEPFALAVRPLAAQPLAFMAALAAFQILASGRATGPRDFGVALATGLLWGVWVRWFPEASDNPVPAVSVETALVMLAVGLIACLAIRFALPPADIYRREDWRLTPFEWAFVVAILWAALLYGYAQEEISDTALGIVVLLGGFLTAVLRMSARVRRDTTYLESITPPRRPNPAAWIVLIVPFLVMGAIGYSLPGSGDSATQSDLLFGALTGFGVVWPPTVSALIGIRVFAQLAREGM
jgi:hypothetical protein